jgi:UDP-glucose 4-epimerase
MRVLVTGTSGRIGRALVAALREDGHWIRGLDLAPAPPELAPDELVVGSLDDEAAVERAVDGVEGVVHLAALMSWHPRDEVRLFDANVHGTFHLARHAARHGVRRFVFASSGEVYPEVSPVRLPIDEGHPTLPTSVYGLTKLLGEEIVRSQHRRSGMPFCILRFAHTQAPEELLDPDSFFSGPRFYVGAKLRQLRGFPPSPAVERSIAALEAVATDVERHYVGCAPDGTPYRMGICDVRDMVSGLRLALEHPAAVGETFNIGPAGSFDFDEAVAHLARATGLDVVPVRLHTVAYRYDTSVAKAASLLGYAPRHTIFGMIDDAVRGRNAVPTAEGH